MDYLWTPWRYQYVTGGSDPESCVLCQIASSGDDEKVLVVFRGESNYVVLNRFPYTSGHVMVVPYEHIATLEQTPAAALQEMMRLTQRIETTLRRLYQASGINVGMNIGAAAGAGVAGHIHMHVLPRWVADSNFMTVVGETRVLPEDLLETWHRLRGSFDPSSK